jgi:hypothetical protein
LTKNVQANVRRSVQARNAEWIERLRRHVDGQTLITHEVVEGTPSAALQQVTRAGDLIVVPSSAEHAIPVTHGSCPVAVMPVPASMRSELDTDGCGHAMRTPAVISAASCRRVG